MTGNTPDLRKERIPGQDYQKIVKFPCIQAATQFLGVELLTAGIQSFEDHLPNVTLLWNRLPRTLDEEHRGRQATPVKATLQSLGELFVSKAIQFLPLFESLEGEAILIEIYDRVKALLAVHNFVSAKLPLVQKHGRYRHVEKKRFDEQASLRIIPN
jgi:hypothetical protein